MKNQFTKQHNENVNYNIQGLSTMQQIEKQEKQIIQKKFMEQQLQWYGSLLEQIEENKKKTMLAPEKITHEYVKQRLNRKQQISPLDSLVAKSIQTKKYDFNQPKLQLPTPISSFSHSNNSQEQIQSLKLQPIIHYKK
ncbi:Hypothetical_protein [Hexamita inflata]|uniref:Hypothetical_protein n=1 Tax=Hexamita inflata TaxID=28002 RepID=A0AA86N8S8_9EUKA|nr:Hypothetical protein HINF_LOCUS2608 [Hexamita inflata]